MIIWDKNHKWSKFIVKPWFADCLDQVTVTEFSEVSQSLPTQKIRKKIVLKLLHAPSQGLE